MSRTTKELRHLVGINLNNPVCVCVCACARGRAGGVFQNSWKFCKTEMKMADNLTRDQRRSEKPRALSSGEQVEQTALFKLGA